MVTDNLSAWQHHSSPGPRPLRVGHIMQYYATGGLERVVQTVAQQARHDHVESFVLAYLGVADTPLRQAMEESGIHTDFIVSKPGIRAALPGRIWRWLKKNDIQVVHTHHLGPFIYGALAARGAGCPHVHTEHSTELFTNTRRRAVARLMPYCARVVAVSAEIARFHEQNFGTLCDVIVNGVILSPRPQTADKMVIRTALRLARDAWVIGCVARLVHAKDHHTLLHAFARFLTDFPTSHLVLVGDGPLRWSLEHTCRRLHLTSHVHFLGNRSDVPALLAAFDLVTLASRREGLPVSLLEAMGAGIPVVATAVGGVPALLQHGGGLCVPCAEPQSLAAGWRQLTCYPRVYAQHAECARRVVQAHYDATAMTRRYVELYRHLWAQQALV